VTSAEPPPDAAPPGGAFLRLDADRILDTIARLRERIEARFPTSGLSRVVRELQRVAGQARERAHWIAQPIRPLRAAVFALSSLIVVAVAASLLRVRVPREPFGLLEYVQALESGINDLVLVGAGIFFLMTVERRIKRARALDAISELRAIAHIVDMHQLTKDPEWVLPRGRETGIVPPRQLTSFELSRYLDYCSETLSLTGKVAVLYIQDFPDDVALAAVNEVEELTNALSRKIWQKLMIVHGLRPDTSELA
jgi:hypothetical protein